MATAIAFDTLEYSKKLISVGYTEQQAETHIEILKTIMVERLATKDDIAELKRDMKEIEVGLSRDMKELEVELKRDIKELELRMVIKMGAMMVACIAIVAALVKLL